jgi:hypothetical protein
MDSGGPKTCGSGGSGSATLSGTLDFSTLFVHLRMTNLMCVLVSVLAYEEEEDLQPVGVQMLGPLPLVQADDPPPAVCVPAHERIKETVS